MNRNISLATLLLLGVLPFGANSAEATSASAGSSPTRSAPAEAAAKAQPAPIFDALNGYVTKEEAKRSADVTARFAGLDSHRDGRMHERLLAVGGKTAVNGSAWLSASMVGATGWVAAHRLTP